MGLWVDWTQTRDSLIEEPLQLKREKNNTIYNININIYTYIHMYIYKIQGLWDNQKWCKIATMGILEWEKREKRAENIFETIMTESFSSSASE